MIFPRDSGDSIILDFDVFEIGFVHKNNSSLFFIEIFFEVDEYFLVYSRKFIMLWGSNSKLRTGFREILVNASELCLQNI